MAVPNQQAIPAGKEVHLILYDGECSLCNGLVRFVLTRDRKAVFEFAPLQGETVAAMRSDSTEQEPLTTFYVIPNYRLASAPLAQSQALWFVARHLGWPWRAAALGRILPRRFTDWLYDLVARHRYSLFGRQQLCLMPSPHDRARFVDWQPHADRDPRSTQ
jgi:predicted DCC family thiol-disulfide oxidoreductase YuxK